MRGKLATLATGLWACMGIGKGKQSWIISKNRPSSLAVLTWGDLRYPNISEIWSQGHRTAAKECFSTIFGIPVLYTSVVTDIASSNNKLSSVANILSSPLYFFLHSTKLEDEFCRIECMKFDKIIII